MHKKLLSVVLSINKLDMEIVLPVVRWGWEPGWMGIGMGEYTYFTISIYHLSVMHLSLQDVVLSIKISSGTKLG